MTSLCLRLLTSTPEKGIIWIITLEISRYKSIFMLTSDVHEIARKHKILEKMKIYL